MNALIPIIPRQIGSETVKTINARELHGFLEVQTRFNDWITNRIRDFSFEEGSDFVTLTENLVNGGQRKEYHLTLDMAKNEMFDRSETDAVLENLVG